VLLVLLFLRWKQREFVRSFSQHGKLLRRLFLRQQQRNQTHQPLKLRWLGQLQLSQQQPLSLRT
jgi:hypothetical protein